MFEDLLLPMFDDEYYPDILVAEVKQAIKQFAKKVAKPDLSEVEIYHFAAETVVPSLDDTAADYIAEAMMMVVQDNGYMDIEMEELVSNREW